MTRYRAITTARIRRHLMPVKRGQNVYIGALAQGEEFEGTPFGLDYIAITESDRSGFVAKQSVMPVVATLQPIEDGDAG